MKRLFKILTALSIGCVSAYATMNIGNLATSQNMMYESGDDGYYQNGIFRSYTRNVDLNVVTDNVTGLVWQDDNTLATPTSTTWIDANTTCEGLTLGGFTDWRLPTIYELRTLLEINETVTMNATFQNKVGGYYWSSNEISFADPTPSAWGIHTAYGDVAYYDKTHGHNVRCVRGNNFDNLNSFQRVGNVVIDNVSKLMWQDNIDHNNTSTTWQNSIVGCSGLVLDGYDDWRLPNLNEVQSIVDYNDSFSSINPTFLNTSSNIYWTSSTDKSDTARGKTINFNVGGVGNDMKTNNHHYRCVRTIPPAIKLKAHGGAVQFDTSGKISTNAPVTTQLDNITIETWLNWNGNDTGTGQGIILNGSSAGYGIMLHRQATNDHRLHLWSGGKIAGTMNESIVANRWYYVVVTRVSGIWKMYVDGEEKTLTYTVGNNTTEPSIPNVATIISGFQGSLDEVRIWNVARSSAEINASMNTQLDGNETGLVAYYNFDERVGTKVIDITSNNHNGVIDGNVTRLNFLGDGLSFDGVNDKVQSSTSINLANQSFSWSAWVFSEGNSSLDTFLSHGSGANNSGLHAGFENDTTFNFGFYNNNMQYVGDENLTNRWIFWSGTYDVSTNERKLFKNGQLVKSAISSSNYLGNGVVSIGVSTWGAGYFGGKISEVSLWDKTLSQTEIQKIMNSSLKGDEANLTAYFPLNDGSGTLVRDYSINENNATISGATWIDTAPTIYGDKIYTSKDVSSFSKIVVDNNFSTPIFSTNLATSILYGDNILYSSDGIDTNFTITATINSQNYTKDISLRNLTYPFDINITFDESELNISNVQYIAENNDMFDFNVTNGSNILKIYSSSFDTNFSLIFDANGSRYWYNFFYGTLNIANNGSSDFKETITNAPFIDLSNIEIVLPTISLTLQNLNLSEFNITSIYYIGADGNSENFVINGSNVLLNGENNLSFPIMNLDQDFSLKFNTPNKSFWYNFFDNRLYETMTSVEEFQFTNYDG